MGLRLRNIITTYSSDSDLAFISAFEASFPFVQAKQFNSQFRGIIGQIDEGKVERESYENDEFLRNNNCSTLDEALDIIYEFEDKVVEFSKKYPNHTFAYVDVDCFGGTCLYNGFVVKNGIIAYRNEYTSEAHIEILQKLNKNFTEWYFEPFTRDFFTKKGIIKGRIVDFSIAGLWLALRNDYPDKTKYYVDGGANKLIFRRHNNYYYHFSSNNRNIEITGVVYNDSEEMVEEIVSVPDNSFQGLEFELEIHLFNKDIIIKKTSESE